jgi:hypothetical protein
MKAVYLLPCSCGLKVRVDAGQAGAKVACSCGQQISVPTFRALKALEVDAPIAAAAAAKRSPPWSAGRGMLFSAGLLVSVIAAVLICYQLVVYAQVREGGEGYKKMHMEEMRQGVEQLSPVELVTEFQQMSKAGLTVDGVPPWSQMTAIRTNSVRWLIGGCTALGLGLISMLGSLLAPARRIASS